MRALPGTSCLQTPRPSVRNCWFGPGLADTMPPKKRGRPGETGAQQEAQPSGAATVAPRRRHTRVQRWHGSTQHEITRGVAGVLKELGARFLFQGSLLVIAWHRGVGGLGWLGVGGCVCAACGVCCVLRTVPPEFERQHQHEHLG